MLFVFGKVKTVTTGVKLQIHFSRNNEKHNMGFWK